MRIAAVGASLGVAIGLGVMLANAWGLATLAAQTEGGFVAWIMLPWGLAITFGGVQIGMAIMLAEEDDGSGGKRQHLPLASQATQKL